MWLRQDGLLVRSEWIKQDTCLRDTTQQQQAGRRRRDSIDSDSVGVGSGRILSGARKITKEMGWKFSVCTNQNL